MYAIRSYYEFGSHTLLLPHPLLRNNHILLKLFIIRRKTKCLFKILQCHFIIIFHSIRNTKITINLLIVLYCSSQKQILARFYKVSLITV